MRCRNHFIPELAHFETCRWLQQLQHKGVAIHAEDDVALLQRLLLEREAGVDLGIVSK